MKNIKPVNHGMILKGQIEDNMTLEEVTEDVFKWLNENYNNHDIFWVKVGKEQRKIFHDLAKQINNFDDFYVSKRNTQTNNIVVECC